MSHTQILMVRLRATAIHFALSLAVFLILLTLIVYIWYPGALFWIDGGITGVQILVAVDLVLGPLLTLIIFNPTKTRRHIVMDFMVIAAIQISALAWGVNTIYSQKPVALVFDRTSFQVMEESFYQKQEHSLSAVNSDGAPLPLFYSREPQTGNEMAKIMLQALNNSLPEWSVVFLHEPINLHLPALSAESDKVIRKYQENEHVNARYQEILQENNAVKRGLLLPLSGRFGEALIVLDQSGAVLDSFPLD